MNGLGDKRGAARRGDAVRRGGGVAGRGTTMTSGVLSLMGGCAAAGLESGGGGVRPTGVDFTDGLNVGGGGRDDGVAIKTASYTPQFKKLHTAFTKRTNGQNTHR